MGDKLNNTQLKVLSEIRNNPNVTKPELEKIVGVGKTSIDNAISALKKKGMITPERFKQEWILERNGGKLIFNEIVLNSDKN